MEGFAIIAGSPTDDSYLAVGALRGHDQKQSTCSATLINPEWIVTAEHCREGGSEEEPFLYKAEQLHFQIGENSDQPEVSVRLQRWISPPKIWTTINGELEEVALDVSFAQLSRPLYFAGKKKITPIPLALDSEDLSQSKELFNIVGFGESDVGDGIRLKARYWVTTNAGNAFINIFNNHQNFQSYLQKAHPGEENIDRLLYLSEVTSHYNVHAWDARGRANGQFSAKPSGGWSNSCHGDSGGPLLKIKNTKLSVLGVISSGFNGDTADCLPLGSRISIFGPSIRKIIKKYQIQAMPK